MTEPISSRSFRELNLDTSHRRLLQMLTTAMGARTTTLLEDPAVVELMLNPDGRLWVDRLGTGRSDTGYTINPADAQRVIELVASSTGSVCSADQPMVSAELPGSGNRFQGILPPVTSIPVFTIRKKALMVFTLDDYVRDRIISSSQRDKIIEAVHHKQNILIVGGTDSGKTTLANAVLDEVSKTLDRCIIIEDTLELQCTAPDTVFLRSRDHVSMNDLLKATMRLRPDRIIVGEVRGPEALTLLKAWNTGHPGGVATVHANSARGGLTRLEQLIQEAIPTPQKALIAEAVNIVIFIEHYRNSRRVKEIVEVTGFTDGEYTIRTLI
ncbi:MAG TPA: P-type conjugative transfer ATPase TrbB [Syntrophorhabdus aromaticivorans]|nr:P-type conjugative transfer ATPase TrbB [Syntrophorhabdus aromaticivorans]